MHGDIEDWPVGDEKAGVADLELPKDTVVTTEKTIYLLLFKNLFYDNVILDYLTQKKTVISAILYSIYTIR